MTEIQTFPCGVLSQGNTTTTMTEIQIPCGVLSQGNTTTTMTGMLGRRIQKTLISKYRSANGLIKLPEMSRQFSMDELFVDLTLKTKFTGQSITYSDLMSIGDITSRCNYKVLITGPAGSGKSTLISKLAYDLVQDIEYRNKFVFIIEVAKVRPDMNLEDVIIDQILSDLDLSSEELKRFLCENSQECLFIVDDYNECTDQKDLIRTMIVDNSLLKNSAVIVTSRSESLLLCSDEYGYKHILLTGFSTQDVVKYISKYSKLVGPESVDQSVPGDRKSFLDRFEGLNLPEDLKQNPLFLVGVVTILHAKSEEISQTNMYKKLVDLLLVFYFDQRISLPLDDFKKNLGLFALKSLFYMSNIDCNELGVLVDEMNKPGRKRQVSDLKEPGHVLGLCDEAHSMLWHPSILQYLAAAYVACNHTVWKQFREQIIAKMINEDNVWFCKFCCALDQSLKDSFLPIIGKVGKTLHAQFLLEIGRSDLFLAQFPSNLDDQSLQTDYMFSNSLDWNRYSPWKTSTMTNSGGILYLPEVGACLEVPTGSLPKGTQADFTISVHWGNESPPVGNNMCLIGPTVLISCSPETVVLKKRLKVTLPHSASNIKANDVIVWSRQYTSGEIFEWYSDNKHTITGSGVIDVSTNMLGCYTPCIYVFGNGKSDETKHTNESQQNTDSRRAAKQSPEKGGKRTKRQDPNESEAKPSTSQKGHESDQSENVKTVKYLAKVYVGIEAIETSAPVPMSVFIVRADEDKQVTHLYRKGQPPIEYEEFDLDIRSVEDVKIYGRLRVEKEWEIERAAIETASARSQIVQFEFEPLKANMERFIFRCYKSERVNREVISCVMELRCGHDGCRTVTFAFDTSFLSKNTTLETVHDKLHVRYGDIVRSAIVNALDKTRDFVTMIYEVTKGQDGQTRTFPFRKSVAWRMDRKDYLEELYLCGFFRNAEESILRLQSDRHADSHVHNVKTYQLCRDEGEDLLRDVETLVDVLAKSKPSSLRSEDQTNLDKLEEEMVSNTSKVIQEGRKGLREELLKIC